MDAFASVASRAHSIHKESKDDSKPRSRLRDLARKAHVHSTQDWAERRRTEEASMCHVLSGALEMILSKHGSIPAMQKYLNKLVALQGLDAQKKTSPNYVMHQMQKSIHDASDEWWAKRKYAEIAELSRRQQERTTVGGPSEELIDAMLNPREMPEVVWRHHTKQYAEEEEDDEGYVDDNTIDGRVHDELNITRRGSATEAEAFNLGSAVSLPFKHDKLPKRKVRHGTRATAPNLSKAKPKAVSSEREAATMAALHGVGLNERVEGELDGERRSFFAQLLGSEPHVTPEHIGAHGLGTKYWTSAAVGAMEGEVAVTEEESLDDERRSLAAHRAMRDLACSKKATVELSKKMLKDAGVGDADGDLIEELASHLLYQARKQQLVFFKSRDTELVRSRQQKRIMRQSCPTVVPSALHATVVLISVRDNSIAKLMWSNIRLQPHIIWRVPLEQWRVADGTVDWLHLVSACNEVAWFSIGIDSACEVVAYLQWAKQHALDTPESTRLLSRLTAHTAPRQTWRRREMRMRRPLMLPTAVEVDREYRSTAKQNSHPDAARLEVLLNSQLHIHATILDAGTEHRHLPPQGLRRMLDSSRQSLFQPLIDTRRRLQQLPTLPCSRYQLSNSAPYSASGVRCQYLPVAYGLMPRAKTVAGYHTLQDGVHQVVNGAPVLAGLEIAKGVVYDAQ